ncbi:beta strand repeat-containing protein, partial [Winogradskyella sp.]|uniref:beta strand repeat-containing protein n=1 Tax=Winogradskyella sp. TaxID=1883156 RepID=UPI003AB676E0
DLNIDANTLVIDGSANEVGIGVSNPTAKLDVNGTARIRTVDNGAATDNILTRDSSGNIRRRTAAEIVAAGGGNNDNIYATNGTITGNRYVNQGNFDLNFDSSTLVIDGSDNEVGIGINNPSAKLDVNGDARIRLVNIGADTDYVLTRDSSGNIRRRSAAQIVTAGGGNDDNIYATNGTITSNRFVNQGNFDLNFDSNTLVIDGSANEVGIGINSPTAKLDINGDVRIRTVNNGADTDNILTRDASGNIRRRTAAQIVAAGGGSDDNIYSTNGTITANRYVSQGNYDLNFDSNTLVIDGSANEVGIGINSPTAKLDVNGDVRIRTVNNGADTDNILTRDASGNIRRRTAAQIVAAGGGSDDNIYSTSGTITGNRNITQNNYDVNFDANTLVIDGSANEVGIGINNPTAKLDVNGTARIRTVNIGASTDNILTRDASGNIRRRTAAEIVAAGGGNNDNIYSTSGTITGNRNITQNNYDINFDANTLVIDGSANNVGIGTTYPNIDLAIGDTDTGLQQQGDGNLAIYTNNNERIRINSSGNVGVGTTTPTERFHVNGNSRLGSNIARDGDIRLNEMGTGNRNSRIQFFTDADASNDAEIIRNNGSDGDFIIDNEGNGIMYLRNRGSGQVRLGTNNTDDLYIEDGGNVGIGISDPTAKLDVNGTARIRTVNNGDDSDNILTRDASGNIRRRTAAQIVTAAGISNITASNGLSKSGNDVRLGGTITTNTNVLISGTNDLNFDSNTLVVDGGSNNVGVGLNNPTAKLDVNGTARIRTVNNGDATDNILTRDSSGNIRKRTAAEIVAAGGGNEDNIYYTNGTLTSNRIVNLNTNTIDFSGSANDAFQVDGSTFTIDADTNRIGIGMSDPEERLNVLNGIIQVGRASSTHAQIETNRIEAGKNTGSVALTVNDSGGNANITFNNTDRIPDINGNAARISVNVDSSTNAAMSFEIAEGVTAGTAVTTSTEMTLTTTGLGIGTTGPSEKLDINGTARVRDLSNSQNRIVYADSQGVLNIRSTRSATFARGTSANYNSSDDWRRITSLSSALDVRNGDVILVNWSTIVKLTGASTTDTLNFEVRLTGSGGCSDISLSGGDFSEINHDDFKGYHGTSGANSSCEGTYTISLWGRNLGSDSWSYKESNVTATVN